MSNMSVNTSTPLTPVQSKAELQEQVKQLQSRVNELENKDTKADALPKDSLMLKGLKGGGKAALIGALPAVPIAAYMIKTAPNGMGGLAQGIMGLGVGIAGAVGAGVGGAVGATTSGGSKTKGALFGGAASAALGGALMTLGTNSKIGAITVAGAVAFGIAGAVGGAIGAKFDQ